LIELKEILVERNKSHGPFNRQAELTQRLKCLVREYSVASNNDITLQQMESIDMILHKIARIVVGDPTLQDHWDDIAGYATIGNKSYD